MNNLQGAIRTLAFRNALRSVETEVRHSGRRKLFERTSELPTLAAALVASDPKWLAEAEWMIAFHPCFAWLRRAKFKSGAQKLRR